MSAIIHSKPRICSKISAPSLRCKGVIIKRKEDTKKKKTTLTDKTRVYIEGPGILSVRSKDILNSKTGQAQLAACARIVVKDYWSD